jgi:hypothetical protein
MPWRPSRRSRADVNEVGDRFAVAAGLVEAILGRTVLGLVGAVLGLWAGVTLCGMALGGWLLHPAVVETPPHDPPTTVSARLRRWSSIGVIIAEVGLFALSSRRQFSLLSGFFLTIKHVDFNQVRFGSPSGHTLPWTYWTRPTAPTIGSSGSPKTCFAKRSRGRSGGGPLHTHQGPVSGQFLGKGPMSVFPS